VVDDGHLLALKAIEDELAIGVRRDHVPAVHRDVHGVHRAALLQLRLVRANALARVGADQADVAILGAGDEEVAVVVELHQRERPLMDVEEVWPHGCL